MFWNIEVSPEEEKEIIRKTAERIYRSGMKDVAVLMIQSLNPLARMGGQMSRFLFYPWLPIFGDNVHIDVEKFLKTFEKKENLDKLLGTLDDIAEEESERKRKQKADEEKVQSKKGWKRFFPFMLLGAAG